MRVEAFKLCLSLAEAAPNLAASSSPVPLEALVSLCVRGLDDESPAARYVCYIHFVVIIVTTLCYHHRHHHDVESVLEKAECDCRTGGNTGCVDIHYSKEAIEGRQKPTLLRELCLCQNCKFAKERRCACVMCGHTLLFRSDDTAAMEWAGM